MAWRNMIKGETAMKLVTYQGATALGTAERIGALLGDGIIDLPLGYVAYLAEAADEPRPYELAALRLPPSMIQFLGGGEPSMEAARQTIAYVSQLRGRGSQVKGPQGERVVFAQNEVKLLAPVPRPNSIRDFSTYEEHGSSRRPKPEAWYA